MGRFAYFFAQALKHFRRSPVVVGVTVATVAVVFLVLGVLLVAGQNLERLASRLESGLELVVYLEDGVAPEGRARLLEALRGSKIVDRVEEVSPQQALEDFRAQLGEQADVLDEVGQDLLPASLRATFRSEGRRAKAIRKLATRIESMEGVEEVHYGQGWLERLLAFLAASRLVGLAIGGLILLATLLVVSNTIRLSVISRREEVEILRLVGATETFLRAPFYFEGVLLGVLGAAAGLGLTWMIFVLLASDLSIPLGPGMRGLEIHFLSPLVSSLVLAGGALVGLLGTSASLGRHLRA